MKRSFLLMVAVLVFLAVPARAEVMEYLGENLSVLEGWEQEVIIDSKVKVCLVQNIRDKDDSHFDIAFNKSLKKCPKKNLAIRFDLIDSGNRIIGHIIATLPNQGSNMEVYRFLKKTVEESQSPPEQPAPVETPVETQAEAPAPAPDPKVEAPPAKVPAAPPSAMITPEALSQKGTTINLTSDAEELARQSIMQDIAQRVDIDQILSAAQDPTVMVGVYSYKNPVTNVSAQSVIIEHQGGEVSVFGKIILNGPPPIFTLTSEQFRAIVYANKAEKIAADKVIDGSFKFVQLIDNNAGLPDEKRESNRTGRFADIKACDTKDCIPTVILQEKKLNYEVLLCDVTFTSNRHTNELATLKAWQTLTCKK